MKIRENYDLSKIKIPPKFFTTLPSEIKVKNKRQNIINDPKGIFITIDYKNQLVDGFASYLAAGSLKIEKLNVRQLNIIESNEFKHKTKTTYVYGIHLNTQTEKEYIWRLTDNKKEKIGKIKKGDYLMVSTKYGPAPIVVTKVKIKEYSPSVKKIKTVIGRINNN